MASKIINVDLDAWFADTLGGAGNGKGDRMGVGMGVGDWAWQNRFALSLPRPAEMAAIPNADAITGFDIKLRVSNANFAIGNAVKFYLERGTTAFTENSEARRAWVNEVGPATGEWPGPTRDPADRGQYEGSPANNDWIGVPCLALGKWWYAHPEVTALVLVGVAFSESTASQRGTFYTCESASKPYAELTWSDEQAPLIPTDLTPDDNAKLPSTDGIAATVSARHTHPEGKSATHYQATWYPTSATDEVPGVATADYIVAASVAHNTVKSHLFPVLPERTAGKWRMRFARNGVWGPWSLMRTASTAYQPSVINPAVEPATLTPDFFDSIVSRDPADNVTAAEYVVYQDPAAGQTITKWSSGKQAIGGAPTRVQVGYGGTALMYGTIYRYKRRLWNRDDVPTTPDASWPNGATDIYLVQSEAIGPTIVPGDISTKQDTRTPTFTLSIAVNIDQAQIEYYSPSATLLYAPPIESFASAANRAIVTPAGLWDWGQDPQVRGRVRATGNADPGPWSELKTIHINAAPGAPYPVSLGLQNELQRITITGSPTGGTFTLSIGGETTAGIAWNATGAAVEAALEALANIDDGDVTPGGGPLPGTAVDVAFIGRYAGYNVEQMTANSAGLTGGTTPTATVTTVTDGYTAVAIPGQPGFVVDAPTPTVHFPFRDTDKDLGYTEAPTRREVEVRDIALAHVAGSPFIITTGITEAIDMPTIPAETIYWTRARYDDSANVRSNFSDYIFIKRSASPTLSAVTPAAGATLTDPTPVIAWTVTTAAGSAQAGYRLTASAGGDQVYDSGFVESLLASGGSDSHKILANVLPNGVVVTWTLIVTDIQGLSVGLVRQFTTAFTQPAELTGLIVTPDTDAKALLIEVDASLLPAGEFERYIFQARVGDGQFRTIAELTEQRLPAQRDLFGRTVVDGLGSPDHGPAYVLGGAAANFDVNGGLAKITHAAANTFNWVEIPVSLLNQRIEGRLSLYTYPFGAAPVVYVMARYIDLSNNYSFILSYNTAGTVSLAVYRIGGTGGMLLLGSIDTGIRPMAFDDFTAADGALLPRTTPSGHVWGTRAPYVADLVAEPRIVSNRLTQNDTGSMYAHVDFVTPAHIIRGQVSWEAGAEPSVAAIITSKNPFTSNPSDLASDVLHLQIGRDFWSLETREGWTVENPTPWYYLGGVTFDGEGTYAAMATDGTSYAVSLEVDGDIVTFVDPYGVRYTMTDPAVGRTHGRYTLWETTAYNVNREKQRWEWVRAEDQLAIRVEAVGAGPTALRAKVWPAHTAQPDAWTFETGDTDAMLGVAGKVGLIANTPAGVTSLPMIYELGDLRVVDPTLPVPSYVHVGAAHNLETIIRVVVDNGWQASEPIETSALLEVIGFWRLGEDGTPVELRYVRVDDFGVTPPTEDAEYQPLGAEYKRVVTIGTYGREWRTRLLIPPESASLYALLEEDKKLGRRVLIKTPDGGVYYSKIRSLSKTLGVAEFLNADLAGTEIAADF